MPKTNKTDSKNLKEKTREKNRKDQEIRALKSKLKKRDKEIRLLKKEKEEINEKFLRLAAEIENLRKRMEREKNEYYQYALSEFMKELLVILDNFERALASKDQNDDKSFREGMELIHRQYLDLLIKKGVKPIEIKDKRFDPYVHQAFATDESEEVDEPQVSEELQKGYSFHERLLRPALVRVVVPKKNK